MDVAIIGAGWAGLAAAVEATRAGHRVTLFEAARIAGGRARALAPEVSIRAAGLPGTGERDAGRTTLDNGQHVLIGAYTETLRLMREVGVSEADVLLRQPLSLRFPDGTGIALPAWPAPWNLLAGIASARGWSIRDKSSLMAAALRWRWAGFTCGPRATVAQLCRRVTPRVMAELIEPLCVSALNTPVAEASAAVFLRVLHDALFTVRGGGDLLIPRLDLGAVFPAPALRWLIAHGANVRPGTRVDSLQKVQKIVGAAAAGWRVDGEGFAGVIIACPPREAARLVQAALSARTSLPGNASGAEVTQWCEAALALRFLPIATVYAHAPRGFGAPVLALHCDPEDAPAQFVFDRGSIGGAPGLLAFVVSAGSTDRDWLEATVVRQARRQLGIDVSPLRTVVEKRATFACVPALRRPGLRIAPGLLACGDYVDGPYPATLEGAVRSGVAAAAALG